MNNPVNNASSRAVRTRRNLRKSLPKTRTGLSKSLSYCASLVFFTVSFLCNQSNSGFIGSVFILSISLLFLFVLELITRLLHGVEEYEHLETRYKNNFLTLLKDIFHFSNSIFIIIVYFLFAFISYVMYNQYNKLPWHEMGLISMLSSLACAFFLQENFKLKSGPLYDSLWIENCPGLDYGSGMAHSFFHGYLKLVIPNTGTSKKHLEELMKDYEDRHHVKLAFYKLFILIPKSLYCSTSLKTDKSPSIEESSSLEEIVMTVAGVQNRVYKNSVYKIKAEDGKRIYVAAEYATPLKTFKDVVESNGEHSSYYAKHKNDIVLQFYLTLQKVLKEREDCTNFCELIYYDDKDENGDLKDVGQILTQRIRKLQRAIRQ
ncbi:stimulator of interferon genes protein [Tribolium madens]|uniref:stimulator of interferon genes protein n=1 Tax=Tribolium madens TaxID=41895 RepID=UPI001CF74A06|nr:stimulator of interferon genes protein [Tribolium madens]